MTTRALAIVTVLAVAPLIPLAITWRRFMRDISTEAPSFIVRVRLETILTSLSFGLLLAGLIWSPILGPDYSERRLATIYVNLVVMVLVAVAAALGARRFKLPLIASGLLVALEWAYLAVVSSVV
jgi:hypothetical protein